LVFRATPLLPMKKSTSILAVSALALACALPVFAQQATPKKKPEPLPNAGSGGTTPHATTSTVIGGRNGNRVTVVYGRPAIKHPRTGEVRKVWGGLVPWDKANRLGADEATLLITQQPLQIGATTIPAGAYTLYLIPSESGATKLAFSRNIGKWGIPIDETADVARVELKRDALEKSVEQLTIAVENVAAGGGVLKISWENVQFSLPFAVKS
jgi:hypothetical protein